MLKKILLAVLITGIALFVSGCADSTLSDDQIREKVNYIANRSEHSSLGKDVKLIRVEKHFGSLENWFSTLHSDTPSCDEAWGVVISSSKYKYKKIMLYRRNDSYYLWYE